MNHSSCKIQLSEFASQTLCLTGKCYIMLSVVKLRNVSCHSLPLRQAQLEADQLLELELQLPVELRPCAVVHPPPAPAIVEPAWTTACSQL